MSGEVVNFRPKAQYPAKPFVCEPIPAENAEKVTRMSGEAVCMNCQHQWESTWDAGQYGFECPRCGTNKGVVKNPCLPPIGSRKMVCNCSSDIFMIQENSIFCVGCAQQFTF